ncbi:MAG TPA: NAD(P)H-hydrate dehydratase [Acidobacteriaceae bacterium]|nr:NAD(P)H-hydrate dehydratase [Acidobacteriaceae bacterium]
MKILTARDMQSADQLSVERFAIPSLDLMENAGHAVARFVLRELPRRRRIVVFCGKGNNGGDGMVAARYLAQAGCDLSVILLGEPAEVSNDAKEMLIRLPVSPFSVRDEADLDRCGGLFAQAELFLDAVVGTGFRPPLRGTAVAVREALNRYPATPVVAVDLPSGWDADSRKFAAEDACRADAVVTFTAPKLAHIFGMLTQGGDLARPGNIKQGPIVVAPIGSPAEAIESSTGLSWAGSSKKIADAPRHADSNKGSFGHVLVIGGARGKAGAPSMASVAALRAGAGLVTAAVAESILPTVAGAAAELMTEPLIEGAKGEISSRNLAPNELESLLAKKTVLAVGPGLGQEPEAVEFFFGLLEKAEIPMVIDADALNALALDLGRLDARGRTIVLTPHPGEMGRLTGLSVPQVQENRETLAQEFAVKHGVTLVLKGWRTLVAHPDGSMAINTTGNPGMAKGGSGDILTGIVAAMLGQYPRQAAEAVNAAVYLHGLAADFAVARADQHTLLALDTVAHLHNAFRFRPDDKGGYTWLQGLPGGWKEPE